MKKILSLLVLLLLVAAVGYGVYTFMQPEAPVKPAELSFPKRAKGLNHQATLTRHPFGLYDINATDMHDLLYLQGLLHGTHAGPQLEQLLLLFKGVPGKTGPAALNQLAPLFYYLDLATTAQACREQLPPHLEVLLQAYADGLSAAPNARSWTIADVFLYHRGLAFLINRCWAKEWAMRRWVRVFGNEAGYFSPEMPPLQPPLEDGWQSDRALAGLFRAPWIESFLMVDSDGLQAQHLRGDPFFAFLPVPLAFEIPEMFAVQGLSLAGVPFLWSGRNQTLQFALQPRLTRDETFHLFGKDQFLGQEQRFQQSDTGDVAKRYEQPPLRATFGRWAAPVLFPPDGGDVYYDWDGLRPSADLAALYYLFVAQSIDEARAAMQYHQVPSVVLALGTRSPRRHLRLYAAADPALDRSAPSFQTRWFRRPWEKGQPAVEVIGLEVDYLLPRGETWSLLENNRFRAGEPLDQALVDALVFRLDGALQAEFTDERLAEILGLLQDGADPKRAAFVRAVWRYLCDQAAAKLGDQPAWWAGSLQRPLRRLILNDLQARQTAVRISDGGLDGLNQMTAKALKKAWLDCRDSAPAVPLIGGDGRAFERAPGVIETSSPTSVYTSGPAGVVQVSFLTLVQSETPAFWTYPVRTERLQLGPPKRVSYSPAGATAFVIRPKP